MPGDEIRRIDWNVYGRTDKLFIKLYEGETNTRVLILLDMSGSMNYGSGEVKKSDYAQDAGRVPDLLCLPPARWRRASHFRYGACARTFRRAAGPASFHTLLHQIEHVGAGEGNGVQEAARFLAEVLNRRGIIILISDFYDDPANILAGLKVLKAKGNDIMAFHIMDDFELTFPFEDMAQFEDLETTEKLHVIPEYLRTQYLNVIGNHIETLRKGMNAVADRLHADEYFQAARCGIVLLPGGEGAHAYELS